MVNMEINTFFNQKNFDIRLSRYARWIDQKCTYDVLHIIADSILEHMQDNMVVAFTVKDIWNSEYARENVQDIFSKPDPSKYSSNEYDKYFGQPIKLLAYAGVLSEQKIGRSYVYEIQQLEILQYIALRPTNSLKFLIQYIRKVLTDSGLVCIFDEFFSTQNKISYQKVRDTFIQFTISNTPINTELECGRIFTKIINPLAFSAKKKGTEKGTISKNIITLQDLTYNRLNWRDEHSGKSKDVSRNEYQLSHQIKEQGYSAYLVQKAKKEIKKFNQRFYSGKSEVYQESEQVLASQIHHIFPQADYPSIADYLENLIAITPNQHFVMAHPDNKTQVVNRDFQYICLIAKCSRVMQNLLFSEKIKQNAFYDFDDYKFVLNTGLETDIFSEVGYLDFARIIDIIDCFYSDFSGKYQNLKEHNYPKL